MASVSARMGLDSCLPGNLGRRYGLSPWRVPQTTTSLGDEALHPFDGFCCASGTAAICRAASKPITRLSVDASRRVLFRCPALPCPQDWILQNQSGRVCPLSLCGRWPSSANLAYLSDDRVHKRGADAAITRICLLVVGALCACSSERLSLRLGHGNARSVEGHASARDNGP